MKAKIKDNKLILEINLTEGKLSKTGKMFLVGGTGGWKALEEGVKWKGELLRANVMIGYYSGKGG